MVQDGELPENRYVDPDKEDEMEDFTAFIFYLLENEKWKPFDRSSVHCPFCGRDMDRSFLSVLQHSESYNPCGENAENLIAKHRVLAWFLKENVPPNLEEMVIES